MLLGGDSLSLGEFDFFFSDVWIFFFFFCLRNFFSPYDGSVPYLRHNIDALFWLLAILFYAGFMESWIECMIVDC